MAPGLPQIQLLIPSEKNSTGKNKNALAWFHSSEKPKRNILIPSKCPETRQDPLTKIEKNVIDLHEPLSVTRHWVMGGGAHTHG